MSKITCQERGPLQNGITADYYEVTADGKVWPCCFYISLHLRSPDIEDTKYKDILFEDKLFKKLYDQDENWNNLHHHSLESIVNNDFFTKHTNVEGWNSDDPSFVCHLFCSENAKGPKGYAPKPKEKK